MTKNSTSHRVVFQATFVVERYKKNCRCYSVSQKMSILHSWKYVRK